MNDKKLGVRDFITVGIFTAILMVIEFAFGMLGYIHPYVVAGYVVILPLASCIPMMLFYTKTEKFGMLTIMSVLIAILMFVMGMGWLGAPLIIVSGLAADLIAKKAVTEALNARSSATAFSACGYVRIISPLSLLRTAIVRDFLKQAIPRNTATTCSER